MKESTEMSTSSAVYFSSIEIENVRCFGSKQILNLTGDNGRPVQWSLLIGENGAGKTTLLECLAWMCPVPDRDDPLWAGVDDGESRSSGKEEWSPSFTRAENALLETLPRSKQRSARISAELTFGQSGFRSDFAAVPEDDPTIHVGINAALIYDENGALEDVDLKNSHKRNQLPDPFFDPLVVAYGANRFLGEQNSEQFYNSDPSDHQRLSEETELLDFEELLTKLDHAARTDSSGPEAKVLTSLKKAISKILPKEPTVEIVIHPPDILRTGRPGGVYAHTFSGPVPMSSLSLGYRSTAGWVVDFVARLYEQYPESNNPFSEPAVVLIDEIDLHLHPLWQLAIMRELSELFPNTQFIATSHSPLIVQVAGDANLVLLQKQQQEVRIENDPKVSKTLRVDQILNSLLFNVPGTRSPEIQALFAERAELLNKSDRTAEEENQLLEIRRKINSLPVADDPDDRDAMDLIRRFAASIDKEEQDYGIND